jgi:hypothetical protein
MKYGFNPIPASVLSMQESYSSCDTEDQELFLKYLRVQTANELENAKAQAKIEIKGGHPANILLLVGLTSSVHAPNKVRIDINCKQNEMYGQDTDTICKQNVALF